MLFKAFKSFLNSVLNSRAVPIDAIVSHTAIVFTKYTILEWILCNEKDEKTYGELFFMFCEDI